MNLSDVLIKPVVTEKTTAQSADNKYVFKVNRDANKILVKKAVKKLFGVEPARVNMSIVRGKSRRNKYKVGFRPSWKKAVVTLKLGDKIELFEK
jgi:large subunit ribosomal protein L23